ncbi:MAG: hypothetical protein EOQ89_26385 [Mesorhizobium sp.]|nr:MAG: hypothetical protein EOQ89_26385 [Mesorhizobium sp.]
MAKKFQLPVSGTTSDGLAVTITEAEVNYLTQVAGWEKFEQSASDALRRYELALPQDCREAFRKDSVTVWRIAPDRALVRSGSPIKFDDDEQLAALELADSRVCVRVNGPGAASFLSRVVALDLSERCFPVGSFAQTAIHHINVLLDRSEVDEFDVLLPTTFNDSLTGYLVGHINWA